MKAVIYGERLDIADELEEEFRAPAMKAVADAAGILFAESQRLIQAYGRNAPAPPGSTPATVTGDLLRLTKKRDPNGKIIKGNMARSGVQYAPHAHLLEYGHVAPDGTRVLPRPFIRQAVANTEAPIDALYKERVP